MSAFVIEFTFEDEKGASVMYAGKSKGGLGWSWTVEDALRCDTREEAERWLENGYGASKRYGRVIETAELA